MALLRRLPALHYFAQRVEEAAEGLHRLRDGLPGDATRLTAIIGALYSISGLLREVQAARFHRIFGPSFAAVQQELPLLFYSLEMTVQAVFDMLGRIGIQSLDFIWTQLNARFEIYEGAKFVERLQWYTDFLRAVRDIMMTGNPTMRRQEIRILKGQFLSLSDGQTAEAAYCDQQRREIAASAASISYADSSLWPRQRRLSRLEHAPWPTANPFEHIGEALPRAPHPPHPLHFPAFEDGSSANLWTQHAADAGEYTGPFVEAAPEPILHWCRAVFNGANPTTPFRPEDQCSFRSSCHGLADYMPLHHLIRDGFRTVLDIPFDSRSLVVCFYWRPHDERARILIRIEDGNSITDYCKPLTSLRLFRVGSALDLVRLDPDENHVLWARLNFFFYERMVLFYNTFVAMKNQDAHPIPHDALKDNFELCCPSRGQGESIEFSGKILHRTLQHALRLILDPCSGVVRLEASACRGPMRNVPIWSLFITQLVLGPRWAVLEPSGDVVSLDTGESQPYVFHDGYDVLRNEHGDIILNFSTTQDARDFMATLRTIRRSRR